MGSARGQNPRRADAPAALAGASSRPSRPAPAAVTAAAPAAAPRSGVVRGTADPRGFAGEASSLAVAPEVSFAIPAELAELDESRSVRGGQLGAAVHEGDGCFKHLAAAGNPR